LNRKRYTVKLKNVVVVDSLEKLRKNAYEIKIDIQPKLLNYEKTVMTENYNCIKVS